MEDVPSFFMTNADGKQKTKKIVPTATASVSKVAKKVKSSGGGGRQAAESKTKAAFGVKQSDTKSNARESEPQLDLGLDDEENSDDEDSSKGGTGPNVLRP